MEHKLTRDSSGIGDCGNAYCRGNCGQYKISCTCGFTTSVGSSGLDRVDPEHDAFRLAELERRLENQ